MARYSAPEFYKMKEEAAKKKAASKPTTDKKTESK
jgi:hypothetical protein